MLTWGKLRSKTVSCIGSSWRQYCLAIAITEVSEERRFSPFTYYYNIRSLGHQWDPQPDKTMILLAHCQRDLKSWCNSCDLCSSRHGPSQFIYFRWTFWLQLWMQPRWMQYGCNSRKWKDSSGSLDAAAAKDTLFNVINRHCKTLGQQT